MYYIVYYDGSNDYLTDYELDALPQEKKDWIANKIKLN